ncbi:Conserved_hypothetical protein [Hexamita inflata]|uniref:Transmembrane protein n=1 Tax=Hexamita inflata TaxID=28002 RepID=A0AA86QUM8_9EUKA|nr:Conserved hypothetical protein [Hexamita inflata]
MFMLNGITSEIDAQTELEGCYSELSRVVLKEDQAQICVQLISAGNSSCKKLPKGVKLSVELENLSGFYTPTGYFSDFNYSSTTELCVSCTNQACIDKVFFESKTASAVIESYGLKAPVAVGVVIREQLNLENCIKQVKLIVYKTQSQTSIELHDYCMQALNNNNFQILNTSSLTRFKEHNVQLFYTPGSSIQCDISGNFIKFTNQNPQAYQSFDQNNYIDTNIWITIQQSNTINILVAASDHLYIDGLPPGYSQFSMKITQDYIQLAGTPSEIGQYYAQQVLSDNIDQYHIKLKISLGEETYFFESNDLQNYQNGQIQTFSCSTDSCTADLHYVFKNIKYINSASTLTSMKKQGSIIQMVTETVTQVYEGCYSGFNLKHDHNQLMFELDLNERSTTCAITTNQTYSLTLASKNQSFTQIMNFEYILNKSTDFIRVESALTKDQLAMIENSESTVLLINQLNGAITDYSFLHKVVNVEMQGFVNSQIIVLVMSVVVIAIIAITRDVILMCCKNSKKTIVKKIQIIDIDELE